MPDWAIHCATAEDESAVVALWKVCGLTTSYNDPIVDFRFARAKPGSDILIAKTSENEVVGSVMVGHDGHRGWVYYVSSHPNYRNKGVGRQIITAAETWLRDRNVVKIMLMVRETNAHIIDFYRHVGYNVHPLTVMEKWLNKRDVI